MSRTLVAFSSLLALTSTALAAPAPVVDAAGAGRGLIVTGDGDVSITYGGRHGLYTKALYLVREGQDDLFLFDDQAATVGETLSLGAFETGTELVFRLAVTTHLGGQFDLFTGAGARNPLAFDNARAMTIGDRIAMVSFEDLKGGGDESFNDFGFTLDGVLAAEMIANPLPAGAVLMLTALAGGAALRSVKRG